mmetsp:Transcript_30406/g.48592  ORF Transcript_30406/g.48592 Transcript_30406/m.48592 type:complete len:298 (+) Transcript_30406:422-1315(+)|eukprot:CAMPEP_0203749420 /NCGR_PEP_ID=MMETSP0098-20131031/3996_1 /ASSEMBLY_ACC=CAM_ASM_000208 /TAXON_ID=96639 /ORGANISM=" , Strain NY0313808BC1" /LENGTH=297 /DNA_ID=CAMNT_0050638477 /DNA_START=144 /DNA_END=1037 /DNA_ORIENTATION=+
MDGNNDYRAFLDKENPWEPALDDDFDEEKETGEPALDDDFDEEKETTEDGTIGASSRYAYIFLALHISMLVVGSWFGVIGGILNYSMYSHHPPSSSSAIPTAIAALVCSAVSCGSYFYCLLVQMPSPEDLNTKKKEDELQDALLASGFLCMCCAPYIIAMGSMYPFPEMGPGLVGFVAVLGGAMYKGVKAFGKKYSIILLTLCLVLAGGDRMPFDIFNVLFLLFLSAGAAGILVNLIVPLIDVIVPVMKYILWDGESLLLPSRRPTSSRKQYLRPLILFLSIGFIFVAVCAGGVINI